MSKHYSLHTLKNGLRVVIVPFKNIDSATVAVHGRAGSLWEEKKEYGSSHFLEHMVFTGSKKYPEMKDLRGLITDVGGKHNGITSHGKMVFYARTLKNDIERSFDFLSQLLIHPLLRQVDINRQKGIIVQELNRRLDNPVNRFYYNVWKNAVFKKGSRRRIPVLGTEESIKNTTKESLENFHAKNFTAENFVLSICADIPKKELLSLAEKYFSEMKGGEKNQMPEYQNASGLTFYVEGNQKIKQSTVTLNYNAYPDFDDKRFIFDYVSIILAGNPNARLNHEIRHKRGMAYVVNTSYYNDLDYGFININAQVDDKNVPQTLELMKKELHNISTEKITPEEYEMAKKQIMASFVFGEEQGHRRANRYADIILKEQKEDYDSLLEKYKQVTRDQIRDAAHEIFSRESKVCVLTPSLSENDVKDAWQNAVLP